MTITHTQTHGQLSVIVVVKDGSYWVVSDLNGRQKNLLKSDDHEKACAFCDGVVDGFKLALP